jgi:hypothetical protein
VIQEHCPLCRARDTAILFQSQISWGVRSDWTPLPVSTHVIRCYACNHLFKSAVLSRSCSDYQNYHVMDDSPSRDKIDFNAARPASRSGIVIENLKQLGIFHRGTSVLDYGCNRGAFVALLGQGDHAGYDVSEHYRPIIEKLGYSYFTPSARPPKSRFDLLTLIHVAEHLEDIPQALDNGLQALKDGGLVVIQVPDLMNQPTDCYVMDHCSHFHPESLDRAMAMAGLEPAFRMARLLPGELTGIYRRRTGTISKATQPFSTLNDSAFVRLVQTLEEGEKILSNRKLDGDTCFVYGGGLVGSLVASVLSGQVKAFIDDNSHLVGKEVLGLPVTSLSLLGRTSCPIVIAVPPSATLKVAAKCRELGYQVDTPFKTTSLSAG